MTDDKIRFRFLMKLCEASFRISKPRQAFAVLNSISGAPDNADLAALHAMSVQVYCAVGDVQKALSTFKKAISGQEYQDALTLLALVVEDLRAAKAFHPVRDAVKALKPKQDMQLGVIEHYADICTLPRFCFSNKRLVIMCVVFPAIWVTKHRSGSSGSSVLAGVCDGDGVTHGMFYFSGCEAASKWRQLLGDLWEVCIGYVRGSLAFQ
eukprot:symbB.v1.2.039369.t1/scaffold6518.1/size17443/2